MASSKASFQHLRFTSVNDRKLSVAASANDAFDQGIVTTANFAQARKLITQQANSSEKKRATSNKDYTVDQLKQDIAEATKQKTIRQAS